MKVVVAVYRGSEKVESCEKALQTQKTCCGTREGKTVGKRMVIHKCGTVVHRISTGSFFELVGQKRDLAGKDGVSVDLFFDDVDRVHDGRVVFFVEDLRDLLL